MASPDSSMGVSPEELAMLKGLVAAALRNHHERVALASDILARVLRQYVAQQDTIADINKAVCWRCHKMASECACVRKLEGQVVAANDARIAAENRERSLRMHIDKLEEPDVDGILAKYKALGYVLPVFTDDYCHGSTNCEFSTCMADGRMYCSMSFQPLVWTADGYLRCSRCLEIMDGKRRA